MKNGKRKEERGKIPTGWRAVLPSLFLLPPSLIWGSPSALEKPPSTIVIESGHVVLQPSAEGLGVLEVLNIENRGKTYEGISMGPQAKISLRFPVPASAQDLAASPEAGPGFMSVGSALAYIQPLAAGKKSVVFSYRIPWAGGGASFSRFYRYKVEHLSILAEQDVLRVSIKGAQPSEPLDLQGRNFQQFHVETLAADQEISLQVKPTGAAPSRGMADSPGEGGMEAATSPASGVLPSPGLMFGFLSLALVLAGGAYLFGYARGRAVGTEKPDPEALRKSLVAELAVLDDRHDSGALGDEAWKRKRAELKAKLLQLMDESGPR